MPENLEKLRVASIEKSSSDTVDVTEKEMLKQFMVEQKEINKELIENQRKILTHLKLSQNEPNKKEEEPEDPVKNSDIINPNEDVTCPTGSGMQSSTFEKTGKWFTLKHIFKNVSELEEGEDVFSNEEEHFGIIWKINICRYEEHLSFYTCCANKTAKGLWSIDIDCEVKLLSNDRNPSVAELCEVYEPENTEEIEEFVNWGWKEFEEWKELGKKYLKDDCLTFEVSINIKNMTGIYKYNLRSFDDPECSDIVLIVQNKKFHVSKLYLAAHSSYFKTMFLGMFGEAKKSEIPLSGIDADDFQNYLEVLYAEPAVDEYTVEGILMVADMYDTQVVVRKCEEFLLEKSKKTLKKKLELAVRYRLENLRKNSLSEIKTTSDIRAVLPTNIRDMDPSLMADLFEKSLAS